jgi:hypothetical protein
MMTGASTPINGVLPGKRVSFDATPYFAVMKIAL